MEIKDSGNRRTFANGGVRDMAEGKGACHLLPLDIISEILAYAEQNKDLHLKPYEILNCLSEYQDRRYETGIYAAITSFANDRFGNLPTAILELAIHYEMGAKKYEPNNWKRIGEVDTFLDSAVRHFMKVLRGDNDEPHDRAFLWNLVGLLWTEKHYLMVKDGDNNDRDSQS